MKPSGLRILLAAAALAAGLPAWADGPQVGFVDVDRVLEQSRTGQQSKLQLDREADGFNRELQQITESARKIQEDLDKNSLTMSNSDRADRERRINELRVQFDRKKEAFAEEFSQHRDQEVGAVLKLVERAVAKVAEEDKLELVVNKAVMVAAAVDITQKVIRRLDDALPDAANKK